MAPGARPWSFDAIAMIKRAGYLWSYYGFTRLHMWGVHIVGGGLVGVGAGLLTLALFWHVDKGSPEQIWLLLAFAGVMFLGCIVVLLASILSLLFFFGASRLGLLEADTRSTGPSVFSQGRESPAVDTGTPPARPASDPERRAQLP